MIEHVEEMLNFAKSVNAQILGACREYSGQQEATVREIAEYIHKLCESPGDSDVDRGFSAQLALALGQALLDTLRASEGGSTPESVRSLAIEIGFWTMAGMREMPVKLLRTFWPQLLLETLLPENPGTPLFRSVSQDDAEKDDE
jgi:hypothetical protein